MTVRWSPVGTGVAIAVVIGAVAADPGVAASRLRVVQALRPAE
jgi:hypothetical protein